MDGLPYGLLLPATNKLRGALGAPCQAASSREDTYVRGRDVLLFVDQNRHQMIGHEQRAG